MIKPENYFRTVDPRIDFSEEPIYAVNDGSLAVQYTEYVASNANNANFSVNFTTSMKTAIDRKIYIRVGFKVTITGTPAAGTTLYQPNYDAPRFMPFNSCVTSTNVNINTASFNQRTNEYIGALMRINNTQDEMGYYYSGAPSFMDSYQNYDDWKKYGSSLNALAQIGECSKDAEPRGGFPIRVVGNAVDGNIAEIYFETFEPVFVSPLLWGKLDQRGLIGVNRLEFNFNLGNLRRCWSRAARTIPDVGYNMTADIVGLPAIVVGILTPKYTQTYMGPQIYPWSEVDIINNNATAGVPLPIAPADGSLGAARNVLFNNQQFSGCPSKIYIWAQRPQSSSTEFTTDTYAMINKISVTLDNLPANLAGMSAQSLHMMSVRNGSKQSWSDWSKYQGSVLVIDVAKDLCLMEGKAPGVSDNIQFQFNVDIINLNMNEAMEFELRVVPIYEGIFVIEENGTTQAYKSILGPEQVMGSLQLQKLPYNEVNYLQGGGFGDTLRKATHSLGSIGHAVGKAVDLGKRAYAAIPDSVKVAAKDIGKAAFETISPRVANLVEDIGPMAVSAVKKLEGQGLTENQIYLALADMKRKGGGLSYRGGKVLKPTTLKRLQYS